MNENGNEKLIIFAMNIVKENFFIYIYICLCICMYGRLALIGSAHSHLWIYIIGQSTSGNPVLLSQIRRQFLSNLCVHIIPRVMFRIFVTTL